MTTDADKENEDQNTPTQPPPIVRPPENSRPDAAVGFVDMFQHALKSPKNSPVR
jgi:hypothetical protein